VCCACDLCFVLNCICHTGSAAATIAAAAVAAAAVRVDVVVQRMGQRPRELGVLTGMGIITIGLTLTLLVLG